MADEARSRLGRGLASLIGDVGGEAAHVDRPRAQRKVPIEFLKPNPRNPRRAFSDAELGELAGLDQAAWRDPADRGAAGEGRARPLRDHRRRAALARLAGRRAPRGADRPDRRQRQRRAGTRDHRERPARRSQRDGRGAGLSRPGRRVQTQPGRHRQDRRQEPQSRRQHDAADQIAGRGAGLYRRRQADGRTCPRPDRRARSACRGQADRGARPQRPPDRGAGA